MVYASRCSDGVVRWFFVVPGQMDAGPYDTQEEAERIAGLWADKVIVIEEGSEL